MFQLPQSMDLKVEIVDLLEKSVNEFTLLFEKDTQHFVWNGKDNSGATLGAGIYLLNISSATDKNVLKIVIY